MPPGVKIRGIYSTAVTRLLLDLDYPVVDPSSQICERFGLEPNRNNPDIEIRDKRDLQGIEMRGEPERVTQFLTFLQEHLIDVALLRLDPLEEAENSVKAIIEFPAESKHSLDRVRTTVCPTLLRHHRLRIVDSNRLEWFEKSLTKYPEKKTVLNQKSFREIVMLPLEKGGVFKLEHIRPTGKKMRPREGVILSVDKHRMIFKRSFSEGRYDGLELPIEKGDYGLTETEEGLWYIKHSYFSKERILKGEYYNINTPVEFYPYGARYLDLEIDIVRRPGEPPSLIDQERLSILAKEGRISNALETKALEVADELMRSMQ